MSDPLYLTAVDGVVHRVFDSTVRSGVTLIANPPATWATGRLFRPRSGCGRFYRFQNDRDRGADAHTLGRQLRDAEPVATSPTHDDVQKASRPTMSGATALTATPEYARYRALLLRWLADQSLAEHELEEATALVCRRAREMGIAAEQLIIVLRDEPREPMVLVATNSAERGSQERTERMSSALQILLGCYSS